MDDSLWGLNRPSIITSGLKAKKDNPQRRSAGEILAKILLIKKAFPRYRALKSNLKLRRVKVNFPSPSQDKGRVKRSQVGPYG